MSDIDVHIGKVVINPGDYNLAVNSVGSCLVVTLYDPKLQIGALAHALLPSSVQHNIDERVSTKTSNTKYVDVAIEKMLKGLEAAGAKKENIEAKLTGGANMFPSLLSDTIGKDNVLSAKDKLKKEGIRIVGECVGGSQGRSIEFSPATGIVTVKVKF